MALARKSPDAFRTISEVAEILDLPAHVLRFWETRFTQIKPIKRGGGRRYYRPEDIELLRGIRDLLHRDGMTIKGVQKVLREKGVRHVADLGHADGVTPVPAPATAAPVATTARPDHKPVAERPALKLAHDVSGDEANRQSDLFGHSANRSRRPFPPDPDTAARKEALRRVLRKMVDLRDRLKAQEL